MSARSNPKNLVLTLGSLHGAGKSTVGRILAERLGLELVEVGSIFRAMAGDFGYKSIEDFISALTSDPALADKVDREVDAQTVDIMTQGGKILDGNMAGALVPEALKEAQRPLIPFRVWLTSPLNVRAGRVKQGGRRAGDRGGSEKDIAANLARRDQQDRSRYMSLYGVDIYDPRHYDLVLDSDRLAAEDVAHRIIQSLYRKHPV